MLEETIAELPQTHVIEIEEDWCEPGAAADSSRNILLTMKERMQQVKWYSMRYWRQGVAALGIYSAMFVIWSIAVR